MGGMIGAKLLKQKLSMAIALRLCGIQLKFQFLFFFKTKGNQH